MWVRRIVCCFIFKAVCKCWVTFSHIKRNQEAFNLLMFNLFDL